MAREPEAWSLPARALAVRAPAAQDHQEAFAGRRVAVDGILVALDQLELQTCVASSGDH